MLGCGTLVFGRCVVLWLGTAGRIWCVIVRWVVVVSGLAGVASLVLFSYGLVVPVAVSYGRYGELSYGELRSVKVS